MAVVNKVVIVGAGLAGATTAQALRTEGFEGTITLVGGEKHYPYIRPPLSKDFLAGRADEQSLLPYTPAEYADKQIELVLDETVESIDRASCQVTLARGGVLDYERLLLATGASPRTLSVPDATLPGVEYLRTLEDSQRLRASLGHSVGLCPRRVVLAGSGWIGMEVAATARTLGAEVTVLGREKVPLEAAIGRELGAVFMQRHEEAGVSFHTDTTVVGITESNGRAAGFITDTGQELPADVIVAAVGVTPNTALAEAAGLTIQNGILTDQSMRTSDPNIYAVGDVANAYHPFTGRHQRSEHWANAINSGRVAARAMLGQAAVLDNIPYFYTDQFDLSMEYCGYASLARNAKLILRGDPSSRKFIAFWVTPVSSSRGRVVAGMNVNVWDVQDDFKSLITTARAVEMEQLSDPDTPLSDLT
ncbi:NAD(P)/FAD-dependent oxidoreductase [Paenarthrobacter aromaticivorans]|uniref:NAD(P)/FAD-dependent oxidoreductase n=1 Tax=Paenarthrobacter aromaticivorans TaxID=2849150 RepID=UPI003A806D75